MTRKMPEKICTYPNCNNTYGIYAGGRCRFHRLSAEEKQRLLVPPKICPCGSEFPGWRQQVYCSIACWQYFTNELVKCHHCGADFLIPKSKIVAGRGKHCSKKCFYASKIITQAGDKNPNWRGVTQHLSRIRRSREGRAWKETILKRGACEMCGSTDKLQCHHIKHLLDLFIERVGGINNPYDHNDPFFHQVDNGLLVCLECHKKLHPNIAVMHQNKSAA